MRFFHVGLFAGYLIATVGALRLDVRGERKPQARIRRQTSGTKLNNTADVSYYADLIVGGQKFTLLVDTGRSSSFLSPLSISECGGSSCSSDLWIAGDVPNTKSTSFSSSVSYAVGSVNGAFLIQCFSTY